MTIAPELEAEIRRLYFAEHWKKGTIVAQLGVHADVVARVLGRFGPKPGTPRPDARVLEPFLPFVDETLERYPRLVSTRLCDMLRERGYAGSLRTLRRYVRSARPRPRRAFLRVETLPGEQAQVDWAHVGELVVPGGKRSLWAFVMVLSYSRAAWGELVVSLDAASLRRSLVRASAYFGGSPRSWLFDNPKTIVLERRGAHVRFHPDLLDLAARMHVAPRVCTPASPEQKGRVERTIRYFKDRFFAARTFHSIEHGNAQLLAFLAEVANRRPHPRFPDRTVGEVFDEERRRLLALPEPLPETDLVVPVAIDKAAFAHFDRNAYSVPTTYAERSLTLVASDTTVRLLDDQQEVARHERSWGRGARLEQAAHRAALLAEKRAARELKGRDRLAAEVPQIDVLVGRWVEHGRNLGSLVSRTLTLLDAYGPAVMREAVGEMVTRGTHDVGALAVLCEQRRRSRRSPPPPIVEFAAHVRERDVVPHDLGGYDE